MAVSPSALFTARMQLPVIPTGAKTVEKIVVDFDFNEDSTALDVVQQVMAQISHEYTLWTGVDGRGAATTTESDPDSLLSMIVVCKDAGLHQFTSVKESLLWRPATRKVFADAAARQTSNSRAPLFQLTTREKLRAAMDKQKGKSPESSAKQVEQEIVAPAAPIVGRSQESSTFELHSATSLIDANHNHIRNDALAPPAAVMRPTPISIPEGSPSSSIVLPPPQPPADHHRSARSPQENSQAETSFSILHLATSTLAAGGAAAPPPHTPLSLDQLPALLDDAPCSMKVLEPQLRAVFGLPNEPPADSMHLDWAQLVLQLPIEDEYINAAIGLQETSVQKWKELRAEVLPGRRHWIHRMQSAPRREEWVNALEQECDLLKQEAAVLSQKKDGVSSALDAMQRKRDQRADEVDSLQIAAVIASASIKKREQLQLKYEELRREAEEFREAEQDLHRRVCAQLEANNAKASSAAAAPEDQHKAIIDDQHQTPLRNGANAATTNTDDVCFDDHHQANSSTRDLAFLSPSLRASVSEALRPGQDASPQAVDPAIQRTSELRALASSLQDYLNGDVPSSATARADLLQQVRKAREAVESKRSFTQRSSTSISEPADLQRSVVGSFVRHPVPNASSFRPPRGVSSSSTLTRPPQDGMERNPSVGSADYTRYVDAHSLHYSHHSPLSPHRYDIAPQYDATAGATFARQDSDTAALAERAVPFFQR